MTSIPNYDQFIKIRDAAVADILKAQEAAKSKFKDALKQLHKDHEKEIEAFGSKLIELGHAVKASAKVKSPTGKTRKPRTKIDPIAIVAKIRTVLAAGKKLNGSRLQEELGINYLAFKAILKKNSDLLIVTQDPKDKKAKLYSLKG
jgi:hypothetical protein